jgi:heat shock protein HspQ
MNDTKDIKAPAKSKPRAKAAAKPAAAPRKKSRARMAKFSVGSVVRHKLYPWWLSIPPELRPKKNQPYYHLLAENDETEYIAYVSEQNLLPDKSGEPLRHPKVAELFVEGDNGQFRPIYFQPH